MDNVPQNDVAETSIVCLAFGWKSSEGDQQRHKYSSCMQKADGVFKTLNPDLKVLREINVTRPHPKHCE